MSRTIGTVLTLKNMFSPELKKASDSVKSFQKDIKESQNNVQNMKKGVESGFGSIAKKAAGLAGAIGFGVLAKDSIMLASNLAEVQNVVDVTFGKGASKINDWSKSALKGFGLSELEAKKYTGTLGALMKSSGIANDNIVDMSTSLTGLAADFASFYNLDSSEAFDKIKSGLSGETEPLKALGINMSVANMEAFALTQGIKKQWKEMSQAEQTQLRYNYLMKVSKDAQGDFARTQTGFANQLRIAQTTLKQAGGTIAGIFLPSLNKMLISFNNLLTQNNIDYVANKVKWFGNEASKAFKFVKEHLDIIKPVAIGVFTTFMLFQGVSKIIVIFNIFKKAIIDLKAEQAGLNAVMLKNPIFWVALAIGALVTGFIYAYKHSETFRSKVNELGAKLKEFGNTAYNFLLPKIRALGEWFKSEILPILKQFISFIKSSVIPTFISIGKTLGDTFSKYMPIVINLLKSFWKNVLEPLISFIKTVVPPVLKVIIDVISWLWKNILEPLIGFLVGVFKVAFAVIFPYIADACDNAFRFIGGIIKAAQEIFKGIIDFITGVFTGNWSKAWNGVKEIFGGIWDGIKVTIKKVMNDIGSIINVGIRGLNKIKAPDWVPLIGGKKLNIPEIPKFALGTTYSPEGWAKMNENGGEIRKLSTGETIIPADKSEKLLKGKNVNGMNLFFIVQGNMIGNEEYLEEAGEYLVNKIKVALGNT